MARKQSTDLGAGLRGLLLGGSVLFLLLLTIVWLTNRHFEGKKALEAKLAPATAAVAPGPAAPPRPAPQANTGSQTAPPPP